MIFQKIIYLYKGKFGTVKWFSCVDEDDCKRMHNLGFEVKKVVIETKVETTK
jgi:hypothetical protein